MSQGIWASRPRRFGAFTLVELLVVIGIIAVLIGVLLPVLAGVSARGRDVKCQSNLRQIMQGIFTYAAEHKGSMPWGFVWNKSKDREHPDPWNPANNWDQAGDNVNNEYISWAALVGRQMTRRGTGIDDDFSTDLKLNFPPALVCPEAAQVYTHINSYAINMIVGVSPYYEVGPTFFGARPPQGQLKPPTQSLLLKDTAVVWDTAIRPNWQESPGHLVGADIDGERFWRGSRSPQLRYYTRADVFSRIPPGIFGQNMPVQLAVGSFIYYNKDPDRSAVERWPYQGNLRFRHVKQTACNVGFADGSVRQFTAKVNSNRTVRSHDALRRHFMIKWPPGVPADPSLPH